MSQKIQKYHVEIKSDDLASVLMDFGRWLKTQVYGSVGYFELIIDKVPKEITNNKDLIENGFSFLQLPDGSLICQDQKGLVHYLNSEGGEDNVIADSFVEFLQLLASGETQVNDLDDESSDRSALNKWLKEKGLASKSEKKVESGLSKKIAYEELIKFFGHKIDSKEIATFLSKLKAKLPKAVIKDGEFRLVVADDGLALIFTVPQGQSGKENLTLQTIQIFPKSPGNGIKEPYLGTLPGGVLLTEGQKEFREKLGEPTEVRDKFRMDVWNIGSQRFTVQYTKDMGAVNYINISKQN